MVKIKIQSQSMRILLGLIILFLVAGGSYAYFHHMLPISEIKSLNTDNQPLNATTTIITSSQPQSTSTTPLAVKGTSSTENNIDNQTIIYAEVRGNTYTQSTEHFVDVLTAYIYGVNRRDITKIQVDKCGFDYPERLYKFVLSYNENTKTYICISAKAEPVYVIRGKVTANSQSSNGIPIAQVKVNFDETINSLPTDTENVNIDNTSCNLKAGNNIDYSITSIFNNDSKLYACYAVSALHNGNF